MRFLGSASILLGLLGSSWLVEAYANFSRDGISQTSFSLMEDRPDGCPKCTCFNCRNPSDVCLQYGTCSEYNGKCSCPPGFGGDDCSEPLCGALPDGENRAPPPEGKQGCECTEGWEGVNCNVCKTDDVCNALMPENDEGVREGGVCYQEPLAVKQNYQNCLVTNQAIKDLLVERVPEATFSCEKSNNTCNFQCEYY